MTDVTRSVFLDVDGRSKFREILPTVINVVAADLSGATFGVAVDGVPVDLDGEVIGSGLRDGSWVTLLGPGWNPQIRPKVTVVESATQLRVVSGTRAGAVLHCLAGELFFDVETCDVAMVAAEDSAPERICAFVIAADGAVALVPGLSSCVPTVQGVEPTEEIALEVGDQLVFDDLIVEVARLRPDRAAIDVDLDAGVLKYNRPPRILPPESEPVFRLPMVPEETIRQPLPIVASLMPLLMGTVMALVFQNPRMLVFGLLSPVMIFSSFITGRRFGRKKHLKQTADYEAHKAQVEVDATQAVVDEREQRRFACPDPAEVAHIAVVPTPRLWERREIDPLWLELRFGTATQPSAVTLEDPEELEHKRLRKWEILNAPATVNLRQVGLIGIAGAGERARRLAQWAVAQLAVLHSPRDVQVYLLASADRSSAAPTSTWGFLTWLPHTRPTLGQSCVRTIGVDAQSTAQRIAELLQILESRAEGLKQTSSHQWSGSSLVVVIDGAHRLRSMPGIVRLLREGPAVGIYSLCLDIDERVLPEECDTVVVADESRLTIRRQREAALTTIMGDWVSPEWLDWVARAIAPVVDTSPSASDAAIPASSRLLDVVSLDPPTAAGIQARWVLNPRSTRAVVGESLDGPFSLDISADGPHGLVAGTTGSGKSELLQTIVAGLAIANTPESMTFVLVDYKGGAAFKDCVDLPHTVGMVTDLDTHLVERALDSLGAELKWREHALAATGAKDLEDYIDLSARRRDLAKIPRLLIVIDEFASLARELPNFVSGLVNVAQRGRSLGIHLILATQRPGGVVSPEIRANTNLRIALRVTDSGESSDVINSPEAANIAKSTPGRAYVRLGSNSLIPFQAGRVGGRAPNYEESAQTQRLEPLIRPLSFHDLASPEPARQQVKKSAGDVEITDLRLLVDAIRGANTAMGIPEQRKPWLPALDSDVSLADLRERFADMVDPHRPEIWFGVQDLPKEQKQRPLALAPDDCGHLYVVGAARTGKTSTLRSIAVAAAQAFSTADVHIYGIDCGNGGLLPLQALPHVGSVVQRHQVDQVSRLLAKVRGELGRRQELLAAGGYSNLSELRAGATGEARPSQIFVLLDSWDGFLNALEEAEGGKLVETVQYLLREGASAGIHMVLSGDRQLITGRMSMLSESKLAFRLIERSDYTSIGLNPRSMPDEIGDGRAFSAEGGIETQIALVATGLSSQEQAAHIRDLGAALTRRDGAVARPNRPMRIEEMPVQLTYDQAAAKYQVLEPNPGDIFLGVGGDDIEPLGVNLLTGAPTLVIAGPPKSGRSTALAAVAFSAMGNGYDLVVAAPRMSPLRQLAGHPQVRALLTDADELTQERLSPLLTAVTRPTLFLADDADLLRSIEADLWLRGLIPHAAGSQVGFVVAGDTESIGKGFSGWLVEMRKNRQGVLFRPQSMTDGDVVGARLKRSDVGVDLPVGRGHFQSGDGVLSVIQIPHVHDLSERVPR